MARPNSRQGLIDYCLRALGYPVIEINVDDDQLEDRIDEALQFYQEYHTDAVFKTFYRYQITEEDVANEFIPIPETVTSVQRIVRLGDVTGSGGASATSSSLFSTQYHIRADDIAEFRALSMSTPGQFMTSFYLTKQYLTSMNMMIAGWEQFRWARHGNRLRIDVDWSSKLRAGTWIVIECHVVVDPEIYTSVYDDMFLKQYATALIKRQWGQNMSKFSGMTLPGGVQIEAQSIIDQANTEIEAIREKMQINYEYPVDMFMG